MKTTLDHLPESEQVAILDIRNLILNEVDAFKEGKVGKKASGRVSWVVLFGSYARGDYVQDSANGYLSDFDILVLVSHEELEQSLGLWHAIEEKAERCTRTPLSLIVHQQQDVLNWLQQGHYFFRDIQKEGVYLYSYTGKPLPEPTALSNKQRLPIAQKHFDQWFDSAVDFIDIAISQYEKQKYKLSAFQLHQATERLYACLLLVLSNYRPKSHNLKMLHRVATDKTHPNSPLTTIFRNNNRFEKRCFELLRRAYIDARYSEHYKITQEELEWLLDQVEQLKNTIKYLCEQHLLSLKQDI